MNRLLPVLLLFLLRPFFTVGQSNPVVADSIISIAAPKDSVMPASNAIRHWRHMIYTNLVESYLGMAPNLRYEYYLNEKTSMDYGIKFQVPNIFLIIDHSSSGGCIGDFYEGPEIDFGWRLYSKSRWCYLELNANTSYLWIRNSELDLQEHGNSVGMYQAIYRSDRYDAGFRIIGGVITGSEIKSYPPRKFSLRSMQLSLGLRYSLVSTSVGPIYKTGATYPEPGVQCIASSPALLFSKDLIPNRSYLLPVLQFGMIFGVGF